MQIQPQELVGAAGRELWLELLRRHDCARLRVTGASMMPAILPGDVARLRAARGQQDEIRPGDVVLFRRDSRFFLHRVVRKRREAAGGRVLVTQGDALAACDPPIAANDVLAIATAIERNGAAAIAVPPENHFIARALRRTPALVALFFIYARLRRRLSSDWRSRRRSHPQPQAQP